MFCKHMFLFTVLKDGISYKVKKPLQNRDYKKERETGLEPAASTLARSRSTN